MIAELSVRKIAVVGWVLLASLTCGHAASAGDWLVVEAKNGAGKVGDVLSAGQVLLLERDGRIKLLHQSGEVLEWSGPLKTVLPERSTDAGPISALSVLSRLLRNNATQFFALGAGRLQGDNEPVIQPPTDARWIDTDKAGERCLVEDAVSLWRGDASKDEDSALYDANGRLLLHWSWPAGRPSWTLSADLFEDDQPYTVVRPSRRADLYMHKADSSLQDAVGLAVWMAEQGCEAQALLLLKELRSSAEP